MKGFIRTGQKTSFWLMKGGFRGFSLLQTVSLNIIEKKKKALLFSNLK